MSVTPASRPLRAETERCACLQVTGVYDHVQSSACNVPDRRRSKELGQSLLERRCETAPDGERLPQCCKTSLDTSRRNSGEGSQQCQDSRLHRHVETGELDGFGMVYLGQQDHRLPYRPTDLVGRDEVRNYPTDFASISAKDLDLLTKRGEQLAHIILDRYLPHL